MKFTRANRAEISFRELQIPPSCLVLYVRHHAGILITKLLLMYLICI